MTSSDEVPELPARHVGEQTCLRLSAQAQGSLLGGDPHAGWGDALRQARPIRAREPTLTRAAVRLSGAAGQRHEVVGRTCRADVQGIGEVIASFRPVERFGRTAWSHDTHLRRPCKASSAANV